MQVTGLNSEHVFMYRMSLNDLYNLNLVLATTCMIYMHSWNPDQLRKLQFGTLVAACPLSILAAMHTCQFAAQMVTAGPQY